MFISVWPNHARQSHVAFQGVLRFVDTDGEFENGTVPSKKVF